MTMVNRSKSWWLQKAAAEGEWASPLHGAVGTLVGYIRPAPHDRVSVRKCDMEHFIEASREIPALLSERDALAAENARLREAFGLLADFVGCYRSVVAVYTLPHVADEVEADRLRELIAEMESDEVEARTVLGQYEDAARALVEAPR